MNYQHNIWMDINSKPIKYLNITSSRGHQMAIYVKQVRRHFMFNSYIWIVNTLEVSYL